ncbi:YheC/YheD family endospore coat-associated protein [Alteribacter natronophilus]|uniref:YheC/YheD family endospore coat-associated protein n=1 Tax=Alteribacter natronophilus TaxID=2583810 RepID=UPI00110D4150|nr:YheC/YheD family protein [Alteribacter natronophilus]TMW74029.1 YheC/YheD family protein [Alteribacter natronophilus]
MNIAFGILQLSAEQEQEYVTQIALKGAASRTPVHVFTPFDWDAETNTVNGRKFDPVSLSFIPERFVLPKVIYDRCFYNRSEEAKKAMAIVRQMKERTIFLGYGLPDKWKVYESLGSDDRLSPFLPETKLLKPSSLIAMLKEHSTVLIKPATGSGGRGIHTISRTRSSFIWTDAHSGQQISHRYTPDRLHEELVRRTGGLAYLIQPFLSLKNANGAPYDLRVVLRKDRKGIWQELGRGLREGESGGMVSNLSAGGTVNPAPDGLLNEQQKVQLDLILSAVGDCLELAHHRLYELGVDIGIDPEGNLWILEVNSKPGMQTVLCTCTDSGRSAVYSGPIEAYLKIRNYLYSKSKSKRRRKGAAAIHEHNH